MTNLLTVNDIAARLRKNPKTIYQHVEDGVIPGELVVRIGGSIRMTERDLDLFIQSRRGLPPSGSSGEPDGRFF